MIENNRVKLEGNSAHVRLSKEELYLCVGALLHFSSAIESISLSHKEKAKEYRKLGQTLDMCYMAMDYEQKKKPDEVSLAVPTKNAQRKVPVDKKK